MMKTLLLGATLSVAVAGAAFAQSRDSDAQDRPAHATRSDNITSTGETVPNPGASQSAGTTSLDRGIQQEDNKIQGSICKGC